MKSRPVVITFSILAGLQILTAGATLSDVIGQQLAGLLVLGIAAVQGGLTFYVQSLTAPMQDVAAVRNAEGAIVAGPAASPADGTLVTVAPA
jgi:hypothetical protein